MNGMVKYHNYLNALDFRGFSATDYDFLMYLCAQLRDCNDEVMTFSISEIKTAVGYDYHISAAQFAPMLEAMNRKLMNITATVKDGSKTIMFVLFPTFTADSKTNTLTVRVNPDFKFLLNELTKHFTLFELQEFTELNSKYSKTLYRLLKQYRSTGEYHVKVEELRRLLGCPESYNNKQLMQFVIAPAVKELQKDFPTLTCEPVRARTKGRPVTGYYFTFEVKGQTPGQMTLDQCAEELKRQEAAKKLTPKKKGRAKNAFNDFEQRDNDCEALERVIAQHHVRNLEAESK